MKKTIPYKNVNDFYALPYRTATSGETTYEVWECTAIADCDEGDESCRRDALYVRSGRMDENEQWDGGFNDGILFNYTMDDFIADPDSADPEDYDFYYGTVETARF